MVVKGNQVIGMDIKKEVYEELERTAEKDNHSLFVNANIKEHIDKDGFFNYSIDTDVVSARKIRFIMEMVRAGDCNLFIGPKSRLCLISRNGEVLYKSSEKFSVDAFLAICIVFNV